MNEGKNDLEKSKRAGKVEGTEFHFTYFTIWALTKNKDWENNKFP